MSMGRKYWDTSAEDTDVIASPPIAISGSGDDYRSLGFQIKVNRTGTQDLVGAFTVEVSNDPRVLEDIKNRVASVLASETALWTDITALLPLSATALAIADGDEGDAFVNITFVSCAWIRLKFTGSAGTDGSIEVWEARVRS